MLTVDRKRGVRKEWRFTTWKAAYERPARIRADSIVKCQVSTQVSVVAM